MCKTLQTSPARFHLLVRTTKRLISEVVRNCSVSRDSAPHPISFWFHTTVKIMDKRRNTLHWVLRPNPSFAN